MVTARSALVFVFGSTDEYSASINLEHRDPVRFIMPAMEATTAACRIQVTESGPTVLDADAAWQTLYDIDGNVIEIPCTTDGRAVQVNPGSFLNLLRCRLVAVDSGGSGVTQDAQEVTVKVREMI